jgi:glycosyltransferase involved in cell wall biosynthesis
MIAQNKVEVIYDYQIFSRQKYGGVSRYFCELAKTLSADRNFNVKILAGAYINEYLSTVPSNLLVGIKVPKIPKTGKMIEQANIAFSKRWFQNNSVKIVHETFFCSQSFASTDRAARVLTVYDMIDEKFYPDNNINKIKEIAIRRADRIVCISESTKNDLLSLISIDPSKVSVIYLGYSSDRNLQNRQSFRNPIDAPYILYVGDRHGYKNFWGLLQAYVNSEQLTKNFKLVCFGGPPLSVKELRRASEMGVIESNLLYFSGDDALLNQFYQGASAFVYPSMYEGFGIPPLEAMSFSCPVICSNTSSIPEVVGNAAEFFDPADIDSMVSALEKVLFSSDHASSLVKRGLTRIENFSWQTCALQTSLVYSSLV